MHVKMHKMFEVLLEATASHPEAAVGFSQAEPPRLRDFLGDLDPEMSLDWSKESFQGLTRLREHVIGRAGAEAGTGAACNAGDVLITAGAAEANFLAVTTLVQPGDEVIVDVPGWPQPLVLGEAIGAHCKRLRRREEDGWRFNMADLAGLITERTRLIFLCNPNNPTGQVLREAELREVVRLAERVGAYVLCDEVYAGLEWDGPRVPCVAGLYERGISTGSVSKGLGLQGLRIGWLICRDRKVVSDAVVLRENTSEIMNVMGEVIAEVALREERYGRAIAKAHADGRKNLQVVDEFIASRPELSWRRPPAGLVGLCRLESSIDGDELARRLLAPPYRTFVVPGSAFGYPEYIRLGVGGGAAAALDKGLSRLAQVLDAVR